MIGGFFSLSSSFLLAVATSFVFFSRKLPLLWEYSVYFKSIKAAFVGDALFAGSIGRTDLPRGDFPTLEKSIREQIYTFPSETVVFPGHGPKTTVGQEIASNLFVNGL